MEYVMYLLTSIAFSIAIVGIIITAIVFIKYFYRNREVVEMKAEYENKLKEIDVYQNEMKKRTDMQYKKLISLTPSQLDEYLGMIFGYFLELESVTKISEQDPDGATKLYAGVLKRMFDYIGTDTVEALDYYYGTGFLERWCEVRYSLLENRRILSPILKQTYAFENRVTQETKNKAGE